MISNRQLLIEEARRQGLASRDKEMDAFARDQLRIAMGLDHQREALPDTRKETTDGHR